MNKYIIAVVWIVILCFSFTGCEKNEQILLYGDESADVVTKLYVSNGLTPLNAYTAKVHNDRLSGKVTFVGDQFCFPVYSSYSVMEDVKVNIEVDSLAEKTYNETNMTNYPSLPPEFVEILKKEVIIKKGERISSDSVKFTLRNIDKLLGTYIYGVSIKSSSVSSIGISDKMKNVIYKIVATESYISVGREPLLGSSSLDRTLFKFMNSTNNPESMIDSDFSTAWSAEYGVKELMVDLGQSFVVTGISMSPGYFSWGNYLPKNINIMSSVDNITWNPVDKCKLLSPIGSRSKPDIQYVAFKQTEMRYIKFYFKDYYGYGVSIGELHIYKK